MSRIDLLRPRRKLRTEKGRQGWLRCFTMQGYLIAGTTAVVLWGSLWTVPTSTPQSPGTSEGGSPGAELQGGIKPLPLHLRTGNIDHSAADPHPGARQQEILDPSQQYSRGQVSLRQRSGGEAQDGIQARVQGHGDEGIGNGGTPSSNGRPLSREEEESMLQTEYGKWRKASSLWDQGGGGNRTTTFGGVKSGSTGASESRGVGKRKCKPLRWALQAYSEEDLARCYEELRTRYEFGEPLRQVEVITIVPGAGTGSGSP
ncbi:unnamed protein product, partial [Discosporangium mesarthrocarpum]